MIRNNFEINWQVCAILPAVNLNFHRGMTIEVEWLFFGLYISYRNKGKIDTLKEKKFGETSMILDGNVFSDMKKKEWTVGSFFMIDDKWRYIAITYDGHCYKKYLDGVVNAPPYEGRESEVSQVKKWCGTMKFMVAGKSTEKILNWHDAKKYCKNLNYKGYKDWRLPTKEELNLMYEKHKKGVGDFFNDSHWSSFENGDDYAYDVHFYDGYQVYSHKDFKYRVRAVRTL